MCDDRIDALSDVEFLEQGLAEIGILDELLGDGIAQDSRIG